MKSPKVILTDAGARSILRSYGFTDSDTLSFERAAAMLRIAVEISQSEPDMAALSPLPQKAGN